MEIIKDRSGKVTVSMTEPERQALKIELAGRVDQSHPQISKLYHLLALLDGELT